MQVEPDTLDDNINCKAHPDEKGIETSSGCSFHLLLLPDCKAYPNEKGIETVTKSALNEWPAVDCKAHPDEKGIETP